MKQEVVEVANRIPISSRRRAEYFSLECGTLLDKGENVWDGGLPFYPHFCPVSKIIFFPNRDIQNIKPSISQFEKSKAKKQSS